jgi:hypothetical protein
MARPHITPTHVTPHVTPVPMSHHVTQNGLDAEVLMKSFAKAHDEIFGRCPQMKSKAYAFGEIKSVLFNPTKSDFTTK